MHLSHEDEPQPPRLALHDLLRQEFQGKTFVEVLLAAAHTGVRGDLVDGEDLAGEALLHMLKRLPGALALLKDPDGHWKLEDAYHFCLKCFRESHHKQRAKGKKWTGFVVHTCLPTAELDHPCETDLTRLSLLERWQDLALAYSLLLKLPDAWHELLLAESAQMPVKASRRLHNYTVTTVSTHVSRAKKTLRSLPPPASPRGLILGPEHDSPLGGPEVPWLTWVLKQTASGSPHAPEWMLLAKGLAALQGPDRRLLLARLAGFWESVLAACLDRPLHELRQDVRVARDLLEQTLLEQHDRRQPPGSPLEGSHAARPTARRPEHPLTRNLTLTQNSNPTQNSSLTQNIRNIRKGAGGMYTIQIPPDEDTPPSEVHPSLSGMCSSLEAQAEAERLPSKLEHLARLLLRAPTIQHALREGREQLMRGIGRQAQFQSTSSLFEHLWEQARSGAQTLLNGLTFQPVPRLALRSRPQEKTAARVLELHPQWLSPELHGLNAAHGAQQLQTGKSVRQLLVWLEGPEGPTLIFPAPGRPLQPTHGQKLVVQVEPGLQSLRCLVMWVAPQKLPPRLQVGSVSRTQSMSAEPVDIPSLAQALLSCDPAALTVHRLTLPLD